MLKAQSQKEADISHLRVLGSTVYVFLHEEEQSQKSEKWALKTLKSTLVGYNGRTIHRIYIKNQNKIIWVKDLWIFEDFEIKLSTNYLPNYQNKPIFEGFLLADGKKDSKTEKTMSEQKVASSQLSQKVDHAENVKKSSKKQKVTSFQLGHKVDHRENAKESTSQSIKIKTISSFTGQKVHQKENIKQIVTP